MVGQRCIVRIVAFAFLAGLLVCPAANAQSSSTQPSGDLKYPRNTVKGGALSERKPGNWISSGISTHNERQQTSLHNYGGATPSEKQTPAHRTALIEVIDGFFDVLVDLAEQLKTALQLSKLASQFDASS